MKEAQEPMETHPAKVQVDEPLPAYQRSHAGPSAPRQAGGIDEHSVTGQKAPTVASPFDFPSDPPPPDYVLESLKSGSHRPVAIPQVFPGETAPFLQAYSPGLLAHGIHKDTWFNFTSTISAFLSAKVGKRAINHAADIAGSVGRIPQNFGKDLVRDAKRHSEEISKQAKKKSVVGVVGGSVVMALHMSLGTALKAVGTVLSLPSTIMDAAYNRMTPKMRAEAYVVAADRAWLHIRGLDVQLMNTAQLGQKVGVPAHRIIDAVNAADKDTTTQLRALGDLIEELEVPENSQDPSVTVQPEQHKAPWRRSASERKQRLDDEKTEAGPSKVNGGEAIASSSKSSPSEEVAFTTRGLQISERTLWIVVEKIAPQTQ